MTIRLPSVPRDPSLPREEFAEGLMRAGALDADRVPTPSPKLTSQGETGRGEIADRGAARLGEAARCLIKNFASTARLMVGVPDYDAYVAHRREMHPGEPIMSYEDFFRERQQSRYGENGGKISRCC